MRSAVATAAAAIAVLSALPSAQASKRGIAWPYFETDHSAGDFSAATWVYNYETYVPLKGDSQEYVLMQRTADNIESLSGAVGSTSWVMGFNEPDNSNADGSGLSPQDAANLWKQYIQPLKAQGKKLVSPAVTSSEDSGKGLSWLDEFVAACDGCTFDAYAYHPYVPDFAALQGSVDAVTSYQGGKYTPLWLSEFGRDASTVSSSGGEDFISQSIAYLDGKDGVDRYAYIARIEQNNVVPERDLQNLDGSKTSLGNIYSP